MVPLEQPRDGRGEAHRYTARFAVLWAEQRHLAERLSAIESSIAWAVARRLSQLRQCLAPEKSRRQRCLRLCVRGVRLWRREGIVALLRRTADKLLRRRAETPAPNVPEDAIVSSSAHRVCIPAASLPTGHEFRVAFIGPSAACEAASLRYRAHNIIEALALVGLEGGFFRLEEVPANLVRILSHDLIVLVRLMRNPLAALVIDSAGQLGLPIVYDIDDYLFDPWAMPYIEAFRPMNWTDSLRIMDELGACLDRCPYFTGSTSYLAERAAERGKKSFVIHNGLSAAQVLLSRLALEQRSRDDFVRLGYFSGTRTHQADFRVVYPALMRLLGEERGCRLVVVGSLDVGEFPGLALFMDQIDLLPARHWSELPTVIAGVDVNLIPLELTPFNEGKSNLKYYEAGLLQVPSIASPTRINRDSIRHGHNGLLAKTPEDWYRSLKEIVSSAERRRQLGQNAFEHVLRTYAPQETAREALAVYREILACHRSRRRAVLKRA